MQKNDGRTETILEGKKGEMGRKEETKAKGSRVIVNKSRRNYRRIGQLGRKGRREEAMNKQWEG